MSCSHHGEHDHHGLHGASLTRALEAAEVALAA